MDLLQLQHRLLEFTSSLFREDDSNPDFVAEVVSLFFQDSQKLLDDLSNTLDSQPIDFKKVDAHVHQFKGSSSSIGAGRVKKVCIEFRASCEEGNREGCLQCLQQVKQEFYLTKSKLESLFGLERQILAAGGTLPMIE